MSYSRERLAIGSQAILNNGDGNVLRESGTLTAYYLDHCEITVPNENLFFIQLNCDLPMRDVVSTSVAPYNNERLKQPFAVEHQVRACTGKYDFGHTSADWESVISLGIFGLRERIAKYARQIAHDENKSAFYREALMPRYGIFPILTPRVVSSQR